MFEDKNPANDESVWDDLEQLMQEDAKREQEKMAQEEQDVIDRLMNLEIPDEAIQVEGKNKDSAEKEEEEEK